LSDYGKRLFRSNNRMLGGVCGGIAEYFGIDPSLVRIAWVILVLAAGTGVLLYLLAWIIIPASPIAAPPNAGGQAAPPPPNNASASSDNGLIVVAIIGTIILMAGLTFLARNFFSFPFDIYILPIALVIIGIAVIALAIMRRR